MVIPGLFNAHCVGLLSAIIKIGKRFIRSDFLKSPH